MTTQKVANGSINHVAVRYELMILYYLFLFYPSMKKFQLKKVLDNKSNTYEVITASYNLHIFYYKHFIYAYSYATCLFYELEYNEQLKCYYIVKTLNHERLNSFKVWVFTKSPKTGWLEHSRQVERDWTHL